MSGEDHKQAGVHPPEVPMGVGPGVKAGWLGVAVVVAVGVALFFGYEELVELERLDDWKRRNQPQSLGRDQAQPPAFDSSAAQPKGAEGRQTAQVQASPSTAQIGSRFRDCPECPEMVVVPAGSFLMGSPGTEEGWFDDEGPVHRVTIDSPFAAGVYEVTFASWDACAAASGGCNGYRPEGVSWGRGRRPTINVSWDDAQTYVRWLSGKTGKHYRLLSESEWEYVARAGTRTPFHTGSTISTDQANYDGNDVYGSGREGVYHGKTVPVGSFPANAWGLHDVHGNVWEWVQDCWNDSYQGAPRDGSAWESGDCSLRILRGGSWLSMPRNLRSANRVRDFTGNRDINIGFRVARTLTP